MRKSRWLLVPIATVALASSATPVAIYAATPPAESAPLPASATATASRLTSVLTQTAQQIMAKVYVPVWGDTLSRIARRFCGKASAYPHLAAASGITNPDVIYAYQTRILLDCTAPLAAPRPRTTPPRVSARPTVSWVAPLTGALSVNGSGKIGGPGGCWLANRGDHLHEGVDFIRSAWTPIRAVHAGRVTRSGWHKRAGWYVAITNGSLRTKYMHMVQRPSVGLDLYVKAGTLLGYVGSTGSSSTPHLHFEVWWQGNDINPLPWLRAHGIPVRGCS